MNMKNIVVKTKYEKLHVKAINQIFLVSLSLVSISSFFFSLYWFVSTMGA